MECTLHITFDCPTENLSPEAIGQLVDEYLGRLGGIGVLTHSVSVDTPEVVRFGGVDLAWDEWLDRVTLYDTP